MGKRMTFAVLLIAAWLIAFSGNASAQGSTGAPAIPSEYRALYDQLHDELTRINRQLGAMWDGKKHPTAFCVELLLANANRGSLLLNPRQMKNITMSLDSYKALGVRGVTVCMGYPILHPAFPKSKEYLEFYKKVAEEIRKRDMVFIADCGILSPSQEISRLDLKFSGLTLERYKTEKRQIVETIINELHPDYLTLDNEPGTEKANTGLDMTVDNFTEVIRFILKDLPRKGVKIGAGAGSWDNIAYFERLARDTEIDFVDIHVYPIQNDWVVGKTLKIAELAKSANKPVVFGEAWLYKALPKEVAANASTQSSIFKRDAYSFWAPLDIQFIEAMVKLSYVSHAEYCTFYWTQFLFSYLPYSPHLQNLPYRSYARVVNQTVLINITGNILSPAGTCLKDLLK